MTEKFKVRERDFLDNPGSWLRQGRRIPQPTSAASYETECCGPGKLRSRWRKAMQRICQEVRGV